MYEGDTAARLLTSTLLLLVFACPPSCLSSSRLTCPPRYDLFSAPGQRTSCVRVVSNHRYSWWDAGTVCQGYSTPGSRANLVEIHSKEKADFVKGLIRRTCGSDGGLDAFRGDYWINLSNSGSLQEFRWASTGLTLTESGFSDWLDGHPKATEEDLVAVLMDNDGDWTDLRWREFMPQHKAFPICEKPTMPSSSWTLDGCATAVNRPPGEADVELDATAPEDSSRFCLGLQKASFGPAAVYYSLSASFRAAVDAGHYFPGLTYNYADGDNL